MTRFLAILSVLVALAFSARAQAQIDLPPEGAPTGELRVYVVSAVLQKDDSEGVIKLVHSLQRVVSARSAAASFEGSIRANFPGYSIRTMLVSPSADVRLPACRGMTFGTEV